MRNEWKELTPIARYEAALRYIVEMADRQKDLLEHRAARGQEATSTELDCWGAYLDAAHVAAEALGLKSPTLDVSFR